MRAGAAGDGARGDAHTLEQVREGKREGEGESEKEGGAWQI